MAEIRLTIDGRESQGRGGDDHLSSRQEGGNQYPSSLLPGGFDFHHGLPVVRGGSGRCQNARRLLRLSRGQQDGGSNRTPSGCRMPESWSVELLALRPSLRLHDLREERLLQAGEVCLCSSASANRASRGKNTSTPFERPILSLKGITTSAFFAAGASRCAMKCSTVRRSITRNEGFATKIAASFDRSMQETPCVFCGNCVSVCPVGAFSEKAGRFPGTGVGTEENSDHLFLLRSRMYIVLNIKDNQILKVTSERIGINKGWTCVKGRFGFDYVHSPDRLTEP